MAWIVDQVTGNKVAQNVSFWLVKYNEWSATGIGAGTFLQFGLDKGTLGTVTKLADNTKQI